MGYHLPGPNDGRLCRLQRQPQLPTERGKTAPSPPPCFPVHPSLAPHSWMLQMALRGEPYPGALAWIRGCEGDARPW